MPRKFDAQFAEPEQFYSDDRKSLVISRRAYTREQAVALINEYLGNLNPEDDYAPEHLEAAWVRFGFWGEEGQGEGEPNWNVVQECKGSQPVWICEQ